MSESFFSGLINNASLLLAMVVVFELITSRLKQKGSMLWQLLAGIVLGVIGLAVMSTNWEMMPGVVFDTRSVLLSVTGLFFGWVPTLICLAMTAVYRIYQGGGGMAMGVSVIIVSCLIGLVWREFRKEKLYNLSFIELYIFGVLVHVAMLLCTFLLPADIRETVQKSIWLPVLLIYPVVTLLLGAMMVGRLRRDLVVEELAESEEKFARVFKYGPQVITIVSIDNGVFLDVNDAFCETTGYKRDEVIGKRVKDLNLWVDIKNREEILRELERKNVIESREYKFRKKNGEIITCLGSATKIEIGNKYYVLLLGINIEDRKRAEAELKRMNDEILSEKQNFENILREMGDAVVVTDSKGKVILVNKAMEKVCGKCIKKLIFNDYQKTMKWSYESSQAKPDDLFEAVFKKKITVRAKEPLLMITEKGKRLLIDVVATPILDNQNNLEGSVWILRDTTKERDLERMRTDFISLASHQLRTPLTGIKWFVELLDENAPKMPVDKVQDYIRKIGESNERMIDLVNDLLLTTKADNNRLEREVESYPIKQLLQQAIDEQGRIFLDKNITIDGMETIPDSLEVEVDMLQLIQVFGNLFNNAASYSPVGSRIAVGVELADGKIKISVSDQGIGIPKDQQHKVFSKFYRGDNVAKTIPGSGLGLYVAKSMVEANKGKIWFESKENMGTTFFVELPIKQKNGTKKEGNDRGG